MDKCSHSVRLGALCGICGASVGEEEHLFCALYNTDNVKITHKEAMAIYAEKLKILETQKRLILVLDLDQTILHTVCDMQPPRDTVSFTIDNNTYCVKLRPRLRYMLERVSKLYEIHVYTMGTRAYARKIVETIDPSKKYFHDRIISRDENQGLLIKNLDRLFPYNHRNIVILDDRPDVWEFSRNLVLIKPFWYFNRVDINDPGLLKRRIEREASRDRKFGGFTDKRRKVEKIGDSGVIEKLEDMMLESSTEECGDVDVGDETSGDGEENGSVERRIPDTSSCVSRVDEDRELVKITKFLVKVHRRYFRSKHRNVKKILGRVRRRIFRGDRFFVPECGGKAGLVRMIRMYGGKECGPERTDFIVSSSREGVEEVARRLGCLVISPRWIADCVYSLERVNYGKYVVCDYRARDEYEEELEEFFL